MSIYRLAREFGLEKDHPYTDHLQRIQCILQDVNACIATPHSSAREAHLKKTEFDSTHVGEVEEWIDSYTNHLPPLENFILPVIVSNFFSSQKTFICDFVTSM
jgi:cob(I)alamin adenosyltransferase